MAATVIPEPMVVDLGRGPEEPERTEGERWVSGRQLRVYRAEALAAHAHHVPLLDGSLSAAQAYADRITRSAWWKRHYRPASVNVQPRVIVQQGRDGGGWAWYRPFVHRARLHPRIRLGSGECTAKGRPAIADPWVILHELAHIMSHTDGRGHGREFARAFLMLVTRWLGADAARALREGYAREGVKYRAKPGQ